MLGRSGFSLLAIYLFLLGLPLPLSGQAIHNAPAPDFGLPPEILSLGLTPSGLAPSGVTPSPTVPLPPPSPPSTVVPVRISRPVGLPGLSSAAGIIFSGTVAKIVRRPAPLGQSVETVAITFHVEKAMRGATPGQDLTIAQWIGLWSTGQRYHVGERVLLFLYPPSKLGLTSAVGWPVGRFSVDPLSRILLTPQHLALTQSDPTLSGKTRVTWNELTQAITRPGVMNDAMKAVTNDAENGMTNRSMNEAINESDATLQRLP